MSARRSTAADVASALRGASTGEGEWKACCPSHDDKNPSLSIGTGRNGKVLLNCFAGCDFNDIIDTLECNHGLVLRSRKGSGKPQQAACKAKKPSPREDAAAASVSTAEPLPPQPPADDCSQEAPEESGEHKPRDNGSAGAADDAFLPIIPPPPDVDWRYSGRLCTPHGEIVGAFEFHNAAGELEGVVLRLNMVGKDGKPGKDFLPFRYGTLKGVTDWHLKGWKGRGSAPLYRLARLLAAPDAAVLVTEGEKKADVAVDLFPDLAAVAPMNGAKAPWKTDWAPLQSRNVLIWPDHDEPGAKFAQTVAALAMEAGAASVRIVSVPNFFPPKWDLADEAPEGADLRALLEAAEPWTPKAAPATDFR